MTLSPKEKLLIKQRENVIRLVPEFMKHGFNTSRYPILNKEVRRIKLIEGQKKAAKNYRNLYPYLDPKTKKNLLFLALPPKPPNTKIVAIKARIAKLKEINMMS